MTVDSNQIYAFAMGAAAIVLPLLKTIQWKSQTMRIALDILADVFVRMQQYKVDNPTIESTQLKQIAKESLQTNKVDVIKILGERYVDKWLDTL